MSRTEHPFVVGARVAIRSGWGPHHNWREAHVGKVYKSGNFVLKGDKSRRQWRFSGAGFDGKQPTASETGKGYSRGFLYLWNDVTDAMIRDNIAEAKRRDRWREIQHRVDRLRAENVTDAMVASIEGALGIERVQTQ